jgi:tetratricopeptide (TPR) repeat protein
MGDLKGAEAKFRNALKLSPDSASAYYCLGELHQKRGDFTAAECCYRKVLQLDPEYGGVHARLARALLSQGGQANRDQAARHLIAEMRRCGDEPQTLQDIGELLIEARLNDKAHSVLTRVVEITPDDAHALHNLAVSCFIMDDLDQGIRHCRKALKIKPEYPLALYNLALAHMQKGQHTRARRYAQRAMTIAPQDANIRQLSQKLGVGGLLSRLRTKLVSRWQRRDSVH